MRPRSRTNSLGEWMMLAKFTYSPCATCSSSRMRICCGGGCSIRLAETAARHREFHCRCYHARRPVPITSKESSMITLRATLALAVLLFVAPLLAQTQEPWDAPPFSSDPKALIAAGEKVPAGDADLVALLDEP